jgi:hypothetical protein
MSMCLEEPFSPRFNTIVEEGKEGPELWTGVVRKDLYTASGIHREVRCLVGHLVVMMPAGDPS